MDIKKQNLPDNSSAKPEVIKTSAMQATLLNWKKEKVGDLVLPLAFCEKEMKAGLINEVLRWQRACARQGTHKAKTRGEVSGGGKKPFRQKGTGNARQGSIRSPLNRAGGVTFGPKPRSYKYRLPSKIRKLALKQALSYLWRQEKVFFVQDMKSTEGKTKELYSRLKNFGLQKALLVDCRQSADLLFKRATANLKFFQFLPVEALNVYDLLKHECLVMSGKSVLFLKEQEDKKKEGENESAH